MKVGYTWRNGLSVILAGGFLALLLSLACSSVSSPPIEDKVVRIGWLAGLTGPAAAASTYPHNVLADYIKYVDEEELIPGVTVELLWTDTRLEYPLAISQYRRFVDRGIPIVLTIVVPEPFRNMLAKDEVPMITLAVTEGSIYPPGWVYTVYPTWAESFAVWCHWVIGNWDEDRPPRIAVMGPDSTSGPPAIEVATEYVESIGIEMLPSEIVPWMPMDTTPQLLRLHERGADYVYICPIWTTAVPIVKDAERLGFIGDMHFGGIENTQSEGLLEALGSAAEGYTSPRVSPWWKEAEVPGIKLMTDLRTKYEGRFDFQGDDIHAIEAGAVAVEAVKRAIETVGYENLNGASVKTAMDSMKNFDVYGLKRISYTPQDHRGSTMVRIYQVKGGKVVPVSDWQEAPMIVP